MPFRIRWIDTVPSTNTTLREEAQSGHPPPSGSVLAARTQTAGRGRFDRQWLAEPGKNLTFSLLHHTSHSGVGAATLPMAIALGVVDALRREGVPAQAKWPNDVLVADVKICGLLCERVDTPGPDCVYVAGVGINVNATPEELARIDQPATSLLVLTGQPRDLPPLLERVLDAMAPWLDRWDRDGFAGLVEGWHKRVAWMHQPVALIQGATVTRGTLTGFGDAGELVLNVDGELRTFWSGDLRRAADVPCAPPGRPDDGAGGAA